MEPSEFLAEDFLEVVYGRRAGWIDLPAKVGQYWVPFHCEWPADAVVSRRIDSCLRDREDLYYSVAQFDRRGREIGHVLPSHWLWADLDEVLPTEAGAMEFLPTIAIESSPGRYQALWRMTRELTSRPLGKLNRAVSYALDADKGGWDLTQVLRIPGTRNWKYAGGPEVRLLWYRPELEYNPQYLWRKVKEYVPEDELTRAISVTLPKKALSRRAKQLLRADADSVVEGERSARLWELECLLLESGLTEAEVFELCWGTPWNKWRGMHSGGNRLRRDIIKAARHVRRREAVGADDDRARGAVVDETPSGSEDQDVLADDHSGSDGSSEALALPFVRYSSFMAMQMEAPRWLVENLWTAGSHGIIGGEPKTSKTTLALALSLAVASGRPFLGEHGVGVTGPVLFVQEENAPWQMQDRMRKIAAHMGLISRREVSVGAAPEGGLGRTLVQLELPSDIPLKLLNNYGFDLSVAEHRDMLEAEVEEVRPVLLVLDPLYLILGAGDENKTQDLRPFLKWLLQLRYKYDVAVALVHHFRKQTKDGPVVRPGQRILGSTTLHGWVDSAMYLTAAEDPRAGWTRSGVELEFRSMAPQAGFEVAWSMYEPGTLKMDAEIIRRSLEGRIRDIVLEQPGVTLIQLAEILGMDRRTVMSRVRGNEDYVVENGRRGRGQTTKIYPVNGTS